MTISSIDGPKDKSARGWYGRKRPVIILVAVGLLAIGTFLLWGPVGLGNGPLSAAIYATQGWADPGRGPIGFVIPIQNSGDAPAVIDGLELIGGTSYPHPHVLGLEVLTSGLCGGAWPARQAVRGFVLVGCGGTDAGQLVGHAFGHTHPVDGGGSPPAASHGPRLASAPGLPRTSRGRSARCAPRGCPTIWCRHHAPPLPRPALSGRSRAVVPRAGSHPGTTASNSRPYLLPPARSPIPRIECKQDPKLGASGRSWPQLLEVLDRGMLNRALPRHLG